MKIENRKEKKAGKKTDFDVFFTEAVVSFFRNYAAQI